MWVKRAKQQDAGQGKRQKQASDPLGSDPHGSPTETGVHAGPFLLLLLLHSSPALVQQVAAVSGFAVAACFLNPPVGILFHI